MTLQKVSWLGLIICVCALGSAYYLEHEYMLAACPLCMLQRMVFMALGVVFLFGAIIKLSNLPRYIYSGLVILFATIGASLAARQLWLQYFAPPQTASCAASLERLMDLYPVLEVLKMALQGSAECAIIDFTILGLSISAWSFILFGSIIIAITSILYVQKKRRI